MKGTLVFGIVVLSHLQVLAQMPSRPNPTQMLQNEALDVSGDFFDFTNTYYLADSLADFNMSTKQGKLRYRRYENSTVMAYDNMSGGLKAVPQNEFPPSEYAAEPELPFALEFGSGRTIRIKMATGHYTQEAGESLMLVNGSAPVDTTSWKASKTPNGYLYVSDFGSVLVRSYPWSIEFRDSQGRLLTKTIHIRDLQSSTYTPQLPFSFVRRARDYSRSIHAAFTLSADEKIFGCGESFTGLNKRGQKVVLWTDDANGVQNESMYKPIPFFMSSRGYGMFMHTSSPITCDFGKYFGSVNSLMIGDDALDLFVFLGEPKDILDEYTRLTGKAAMPPLWSFGLWMSRLTYYSEEEGRQVAALLRQNKIPSDVIHFDTGWFEKEWKCDYKFSTSRFKDPEKMMQDLKSQGFHLSLWQYPYFMPKNDLYQEIVSNKYYVADAKGNVPFEDAIIDFSNPEAVSWYQEKIADLLKLGVAAIKVDFGEAAPLNGYYASGRSGFYEHNLYPLRYNKAVADISKSITGENIIWARSAWAGSQRYPIHWGGDAECSNNGMLAELRGGLSLGLSGFSFWSHDIGGFIERSPESVYRRWLPFGILSSHSRCHGQPPKEPWAYNAAFTDFFRDVVSLKYRLMPYVYAQAKLCTEKGLPMVRALFVEYPHDPGAWLIENEYLFGSDLLVAPMVDETSERDVYVPGNDWIDYFTGQKYNPGWHRMKAGDLAVILLVRDGSAIPHVALVQSTMQIDWTKIDLKVFTSKSTRASGYLCLPSDNQLHKISLVKSGNAYKVLENPLSNKVTLRVQ
jgi:alpha-D-xyloside xylohydrolase